MAERDKLMQTFILNNGSETKVKESCVLQSYKSKLASIQRKLESLKKYNTDLKTENSTLKENEQLLDAQVTKIGAEKEVLHNECVMMS